MTGTSHSTLTHFQDPQAAPTTGSLPPRTHTCNRNLLAAPTHITVTSTHTHTWYWDPHLYLYPSVSPLPVPIMVTPTHTCIHY